MSKKAFILLAEGFEDVEAMTPLDVLNRAGVDVKTVSITESYEVVSTSKMTYKTHLLLKDVLEEEIQLLVLPGGMPGTTNIAASEMCVDYIKAIHKKGILIAAICAAPGYVLAEACGLLKGVKACGYPGTEVKIKENGGIPLEEPVVVDKNFITSRSPGTAMIFAYTIVKEFVSEEKAKELKGGMLMNF
ncbi:protein/nucleic acid deglycase dj-1 [Anaeramoeba flamelloides]|uniref:Protein/nucleic acid deglycase dj-1 n=1 Tax=Anaeramoeba flamelloides TaxID=1746091 RepID=A0AAV7ZQ09_9EUKA|nr:protein/nucleic acid deglycase dj-1 [Anaeramoeba flamelloides]